MSAAPTSWWRRALSPLDWPTGHTWLLAVGLVLRLAYGLHLGREDSFGGWDGKEYHAYAWNLLHFAGDDYPRYFDCVRAPLYPIFLMPFVAWDATLVWPVQVVQAFTGVLQCVVLAVIAARWAGSVAGRWALWLTLLHPVLVYQSGFVLTENLFTLLLWGGVACLQRLLDAAAADTFRWSVWGGLLLGLGCLTRPALQPFLPVAVLWLGFVLGRRAGWRAALGRMTWFTLVSSAVLLPWLAGNQWVHQEFTLAPRNGPLAYVLGRSRAYLATYEARDKAEYYRILGGMMERVSVRRTESPAEWVAEARRFAQEDPAAWARLQRHKFLHFWTPWLNPKIFSPRTVWLSAGLFVPVFLLAGGEILRRLRRPDAFLVLLLGIIGVGYLVGGYLFHVQIRYRFPFVDVAFLVLSAACLGRLTARWQAFRAAARSA